MAERDLVFEILATLGRRHDMRAWRVNVVRMGRVLSVPKGHPDIMGVLQGGRMLAIECKSPKGRLTAEQQTFALWLTSMGALYICARNLNDVLFALPPTPLPF